jgi:hypothetical protein
MPWKAISWWALGIVVAFALLLYSSQPFHSCLQEAGKYYRGDASQEALSGLIVVKSFKSCIGTYILEKNAVITALATIAIAAFTATIWAINKRQWQHGRQVERAYISGGFGGADDDTGAIYPSIQNDGNTPCVVNYVAVDTKPLAELPQKPVYPERKFVNYQIPPHGRLVASHVWVFMKKDKDEIFYGRFWYTDIFGDEHTSGFALHLGKPAMPALEGFPEYWKWT